MIKRTFTITLPHDSIRLHPGDIAEALKPMTGDDITVTEVTTRHYTIWSEGYHITGNLSKAQYHGCIVSTSFQAACDIAFNTRPDYNSSKLTLWACKLFDNETDARKAFG